MAQQLLGRGAVAGAAGDADAGRDPHLLVLEPERLDHRGHDPPRGRRDVARLARPLLEHRELVPAQPGDEVALADHAPDPPRHLPQQLVPGRVAVRVVHRLEPVEVEDQQRQTGRPVLRRDDEPGQPLRQQRAVRQAGERVVLGLVTERLGALALGEVDQHELDGGRVARHRDGAGVDQQLGPVEPPAADLHRRRTAGCGRLLDRGPQPSGIARRHELVEGATQEFRGIPARQQAHGDRVGEGAQALGVGQDRDRGRLEQTAVPLLARPQRLLEPLRFGDVDDVAVEVGAAVGLVADHPGDLAHPAQLARRRVGDPVVQRVGLVLLLAAPLERRVGGPVLGVDRLVPDADPRPAVLVDGAGQPLRVRAVELRTALVVAVGVVALDAVAEDDVAHVGDERAEAPLAVAQLQPGLDLLRHVAAGAAVAAELAARPEHRPAARLGDAPPPLPVPVGVGEVAEGTVGGQRLDVGLPVVVDRVAGPQLLAAPAEHGGGVQPRVPDVAGDVAEAQVGVRFPEPVRPDLDEAPQPGLALG